MPDKDKKKRKHDIMLGLALLLIATVLFVIDLTKASSENISDKKVVVSVDGRKISEYSLSKNGEYELEGSHLGTNTLIIKDGKAYISKASCPDKHCIKQGKISRSGEILVCLPNRVVVKIVDINKDEQIIDGVSG